MKMIDVGNTYFDTEAERTEQQGRYHKCRDLTNPKTGWDYSIRGWIIFVGG